jgi:hypothetical protein
MVRIRFPPAESLGLTQTGPRQGENRAFGAGVRRSVGGAVGRDAQAGAISRQRIAISLSGLIPVPQCPPARFGDSDDTGRQPAGCLGTCRFRLGVEPDRLT